MDWVIYWSCHSLPIVGVQVRHNILNCLQVRSVKVNRSGREVGFQLHFWATLLETNVAWNTCTKNWAFKPDPVPSSTSSRLEPRSGSNAQFSVQVFHSTFQSRSVARKWKWSRKPTSRPLQLTSTDLTCKQSSSRLFKFSLYTSMFYLKYSVHLHTNNCQTWPANNLKYCISLHTNNWQTMTWSLDYQVQITKYLLIPMSEHIIVIILG